MTVKDLLKVLKTMPKDLEVWHLWDGDARTQVNHVWISRDGRVITADTEEPCYKTSVRPPSAPSKKQLSVWVTGRH